MMQCTQCNRDDCALPHAANYHRPYHADPEQLTRLLERLSDSGCLKFSVDNGARDFELQIRGRQRGPSAPESTVVIDSISVRVDGRVVFDSADFHERQREVYHRCLFSTRTKKQRHSEHVINCIRGTWLWEFRTTQHTICEVAAAVICQFGDQKFYHREHASSPRMGVVSNAEVFDLDEHYQYLINILQPCK